MRGGGAFGANWGIGEVTKGGIRAEIFRAGPRIGGRVVGKNFSCNNLGQRKASDFYETPYSLTRQFLEVEGAIKQFSSI